ncbi:MAG: aspC3 [Chlamydiales bacterium]|jgi:LL-diaminopimelate aminotransferase|nr:aspC3 [Chlamydiales bacterium]
MIKRNPFLQQLKKGYLFPEILKKKEAFLLKNPAADLISLGIGDTTEPLGRSIAEKMQEAAAALATPNGYRGYGSTQGSMLLRRQIAEELYQGSIDPEEIFLSDGAKPDLGRLQLLFGAGQKIALQDPAYPVYADTASILGSTELEYLPCCPENDFCPPLPQNSNILCLCSPNNPTGAALTKEQLEKFVRHAQEKGQIIIFDSAYSAFITDSNLPKSIYEIDGAHDVAIETGSFSKMAGFTGIRLGWTIVPKALRFTDGYRLRDDFDRIASTFFNGPSLISEAGGIAALSEEGRQECQQTLLHYLENARLLKQALEQSGQTCYGGTHAPYLWLDLKGKDSWQAFDELLEKAHLITTPGSGFGPSGEGFLRLSAFGHRLKIEQAAQRLKDFFSKHSCLE